jgi:hypothetical protein
MAKFNYNHSTSTFKIIGGSKNTYIFGFSFLYDLLRWYLDPQRSCATMAKEFLPKDALEIYWRPVPIIIFRRDQTESEKLKEIFDDFQKSRVDFQKKRDDYKKENQNKPKNPNSTKLEDLPYFKIVEIRIFDKVISYNKIHEYEERRNTEKFIKNHPNLKFFAICNTKQIIVKKEENSDQRFDTENLEVDSF